MRAVHRWQGVAFAASVATSVQAQSLPPLSPDLAHVAVVSCIEIDDEGVVSGAFLLTSTGNAVRDAHLLAWIKQLRWARVAPGETSRNVWFPMPIATGGVPTPPPPDHCAPSV